MTCINFIFDAAFAFTHILSNHQMELIGYAADDRTTDEDSSEIKSWDQMKKQTYATQKVDRIFRLASKSFVLIQLTSSIKSDRLWPLSEQVLFDLDIDSSLELFVFVFFSIDFEQIRFVQCEFIESGLHSSVSFNNGLCDNSRST